MREKKVSLRKNSGRAKMAQKQPFLTFRQFSRDRYSTCQNFEISTVYLVPLCIRQYSRKINFYRIFASKNCLEVKYLVEPKQTVLLFTKQSAKFHSLLFLLSVDVVPSSLCALCCSVLTRKGRLDCRLPFNSGPFAAFCNLLPMIKCCGILLWWINF